MTEIGLTINDILSFNSLLAQRLQVIRIHCHTPGLCLQVLSTGLQLSPQQSIMGIWMTDKKIKPGAKCKQSLCFVVISVWVSSQDALVVRLQAIF